MIDSFFVRNDAEEFGGGLYIGERGYARIAGSNFNFNTARTRGGGAYNDGFARITGTSFVNNIVGIEAGAVFTGVTGDTEFVNPTFVNNQPDDTN